MESRQQQGSRRDVHPAEEVERLAAEQRQHEQIPVHPKTAHELHESTCTALDQLQSSYPHAADIVTQIDARIRRWLGYDRQQLTVVGQVIHHTPGVLAELSVHLRAELNPLLHRLQEVCGDEVDVLRLLDYGYVDTQLTGTMFGLIDGLSTHDVHVPRQLIVLDPLAETQSNIDYLNGRLQHHEFYGRVTGDTPRQLSQFYHMRSQSAVYELMIAAAALTPNDPIARAYQTIIHAIDDWSTVFESDMRVAVQRIDFVHGSQAQVFALLNAAETIKHANPQLFARLLGVSVDWQPTGEAVRSDLYGNAFHIAFTRTQQMRIATSQVSPGLAMLHRRLTALTELDTHQLPLHSINADQLQMLIDRLTAELAKPVSSPLPAADQSTSTTVDDPNPVAMITLLSLISQFGAEVQLAQLLKQVSLPEYESTCRRLAGCGPREFYAIIRALPEHQLSDTLIHDVIGERLPCMISYDKLRRHCSAFVESWRLWQQSVKPGEADRLYELRDHVATILSADPFFVALATSGDSLHRYDLTNEITSVIVNTRDEQGLTASIADQLFGRYNSTLHVPQTKTDGYRSLRKLPGDVDQNDGEPTLRSMLDRVRDNGIERRIRLARFSDRVQQPAYDQLLWETADDRELLTPDFFRFCANQHTTAYDVLIILAYHRSLTAVDWEQWARTFIDVPSLWSVSSRNEQTLAVMSQELRHRVDSNLPFCEGIDNALRRRFSS